MPPLPHFTPMSSPSPSLCTAELWHWHSYRQNPSKHLQLARSLILQSKALLSKYHRLYSWQASSVFMSWSRSREEFARCPNHHTLQHYISHEECLLVPLCCSAPVRVCNASEHPGTPAPLSSFLSSFSFQSLLLSGTRTCHSCHTHTRTNTHIHRHTHALTALCVLLNVSSTYCSCGGKEGRLNQTEDRLPCGLPCL